MPKGLSNNPAKRMGRLCHRPLALIGDNTITPRGRCRAVLVLRGATKQCCCDQQNLWRLDQGEHPLGDAWTARGAHIRLIIVNNFDKGFALSRSSDIRLSLIVKELASASKRRSGILRLVMPLGSIEVTQQLTVVEKIAPGETRMRSITLVRFVPFTRSQD